MFYLHVSNRTENLLKQLAEVMRADKQPDLFSKELFLIQSQGMERMVAQAMADEFRSFCNFKFFLPLDFLSFIAGKIGLDSTSGSFTRQTLAWRLDALLRDVSAEVYKPLRNYLQGHQVELKRYQLASRLAYVFDQYQIMRPEMLNSWTKGVTVTKNDAEPWQMDLWFRLLRQTEGEIHRGVVFQQVIEALGQKNEVDLELPKRISVIGVHTLPPLYLDFLNRLAKIMEVHFLLLSPCRDYWDNSETRRSFLQNNGSPSAADLVKQAETHHPLLTNLGRQGRDLLNMMLERTDIGTEFASYESPCDDSACETIPLLARLQGDLLNGSLPDASQITEEDDNSVQIVSCHSKQRELMVLKDNLLYLLHEDESLELRDIVVMAPDIQEYSGLIPAFFNDFQHSIADRSLRRRNSTIQAFVTFLNLIGGRFGWSEVMDLLRQEVLYPQFELTLSELDRLQDWVIGSGIRWGLSGTQRQQAGGADIKETSWQAGIERMLMGYTTNVDCFVDDILPYSELEGQGAQPLGGLSEFVRIISQAEQLFKKGCTLVTWSGRLLKITDKLFGMGVENDLGELRTLILELSDSSASFHTHTIGFEVIREWFEKSTTESRSSSGFLRGQLTFCSMLPMRSIPFKVVCLIGLNDTVFPKNDIHDTFDLMGDSYRQGDRSPRADDRYQFLEAILAARSHLYLSYIGQSIKTNKKIPPSVVVSELIDLLNNYYGGNDQVTHHPLHPFSMSYFNKSHPKKFSYDNYHCRTARILQQDSAADTNWLQSKLEPADEIIEFNDLLTFFCNPQKYFVRNCLGIRLGGDTILPDESELFEIKGLAKYGVEQEILGAIRNGETEDLSLKLQNRGHWILGNPGQMVFEKWREEVANYYETVSMQVPGEVVKNVVIDLMVDPYKLMGSLSNCYEHGVLILRYGKLRGRDLLSGWLHHQVATRMGLDKWTRVVAADGVVGFSLTGNDPSLETLIDIYRKGCETPSMLFIEPAFAHLQQQLKSGPGMRPLEAARKKYQYSMDNGYELEWEILFGSNDPAEVLGEEFEELSNLVMHQIWSNRDE